MFCPHCNKIITDTEVAEAEDRTLVADMRQYILMAKQGLGIHGCERCGIKGKPMDIHHKRYGRDITIYDLELLCESCHREIPTFNMLGNSTN